MSYGLPKHYPSFKDYSPHLISGNSCFIQFVNFLVVYDKRAIPKIVNPSRAEALVFFYFYISEI